MCQEVAGESDAETASMQPFFVYKFFFNNGLEVYLGFRKRLEFYSIREAQNTFYLLGDLL